jgi:hypothetical protein
MPEKPYQCDEETGLDREPQTAAGGSGAGSGRGSGSGSGQGGGKLRAGQNILCIVQEPSPGGYDVLVVKANQQGFLPTRAKLKPGTKLVGQFVCTHKGRLLLSAQFTLADPT